MSKMFIANSLRCPLDHWPKILLIESNQHIIVMYTNHTGQGPVFFSDTFVLQCDFINAGMT